jgi:FecR protein.
MIDDQEKYARIAARILAERLPDLAEDRPSIGRDRLVSTVAVAIRAKVRRRRIAYGGLVLVVAAGALFAVRFSLRSSSAAHVDPIAMSPIIQDLSGRDHLLFRDGAWQSLSGPRALSAGDRVHLAESGGSVLSFADGTHVDLAGGSEVQIVELGMTRRIFLDHGQLGARVAKLDAGKRFLIMTRDSEVEVHGTIFTVEAGQSNPVCAGASVSTRVRVSEGVVTVRHAGETVHLRADDAWPCPEADTSEVESPRVAEKIPTVGTVRAVDRAPQAPVRTRAAVGSQVAEPDRQNRSPVVKEGHATSSLAEQNDLFAEAMAAEHEKQRDVALRKLDELLRRFPGGPLDESARAERNKILPGLPR